MSKRKFSNRDIANYYLTSQWLYKYFCYNPSSLGMHLGFWDAATKNRQEAISLENDYVIKAAGIKKGMKVLDAGCGIGGTALHVAQKTGAKVWGITITPSQVTLAKKYAKEKGLERLVTFSVDDYTKTKFPDNFFDVVYGIESVCYASPKSTFLKEAYRIVKPGGKVVIADAYLAKQPTNAKEKKIVEDFAWGFALNEFITEKEMASQIQGAGFVKIKREDVLQKVVPSITYYTDLTNVTKLLCLISRYIPISHIQAIYKNYVSLKTFGEGNTLGLVAYFIHCAEKPK